MAISTLTGKYTGSMTISICKYCHSEHVIKYGTQRGVQYYLCKNCGHKFASNDTLPNMRYNTKDIGCVLDMYYEGNSLNQILSCFIQQKGSYLSKATPYNWLTRFTAVAKEETVRYKPNLSSIWALDIQTVRNNGKNVFLFDLIDSRTRFLILSSLSETYTSNELQTFTKKAFDYTEDIPRILYAHLKKQKNGVAIYTDNFPFKIIDNDFSIEQLHLNFNGRLRIINSLKSIATTNNFLDGWQIYYNFFLSNSILEGKTPAETACIKFPYKNWQDIAASNCEISSGMHINKYQESNINRGEG